MWLFKEEKMEDFKPIEYRWNNYDNPSSNMRLNKKYLKDLLLVCDFAINSNEAKANMQNMNNYSKILYSKFKSDILKIINCLSPSSIPTQC